MSLPPELWLHVFDDLCASDLRAVSLTCQSFRYLAQPKLFTVLDVSPFFLAYNTDRPILRPQKYLSFTLSRLSVYQLPHIAPSVRHCWVSPYARSGFPPRNHRDDLDPALIIDPLIASLPAFPNLHTLSWHCIDITPLWWSALRAVPFNHIWLNSCSVLAPDPLPITTVTHLDLDHWAWEGHITNHVSIHEERADGVAKPLLPLVIPPLSIHSISVPRTDTALRLLSTLADSQVPFSLLHSLSIPFAATSNPSFLPALVSSPALTHLHILPPTDDQPNPVDLHLPIPHTALPLLRSYQGPYTHLLQFAAPRPLTKIALWGFDGLPAVCDPDDLVPVLLQFAAESDALEVIQLSVTRITRDLLRVFHSFRNLRSASVESQDGPAPHLVVQSELDIRFNSPITLLYILLQRTTLPHTLRHLRLSTRLNSGNLDIPTQEAEAAKCVEGLAGRHLNLEDVEVGYGVYWTGMYSFAWTRTKERGGGKGFAATSTTPPSTSPSTSSTPSPSSSPSQAPTPTPTTTPSPSSSPSLSRTLTPTPTPTPTPAPPTPSVQPHTNITSTTIPLPRGTLVFTQHKRSILFADADDGGFGSGYGVNGGGGGGVGDVNGPGGGVSDLNGAGTGAGNDTGIALGYGYAGNGGWGWDYASDYGYNHGHQHQHQRDYLGRGGGVYGKCWVAVWWRLMRFVGWVV